MVDEICQLYYGRSLGAVEQVYKANPGLAALGPRLPAGTQVVLPDLAPVDQEKQKVVTPWS